jgi:lipid II:glycine glycyltransferase (peptidoglycan interpeptide bridge formation enzyme)
MTNQETQIGIIKEQMKQNSKEHEEIKKMLARIQTTIDTLDARFSLKWVEKGVIIIISAIVLGAVYTVFQKAGVPIK